jgi:two-component system CheB/CheR fusion protein
VLVPDHYDDGGINLTPISHEIRSRNDRWYEVRLHPYRTLDDRIDGVVLTFVDMTERRHIAALS